MPDALDPEDRERLLVTLAKLTRLLDERGEGSQRPASAQRIARLHASAAGVLFALRRDAETLDHADRALAIYRREPLGDEDGDEDERWFGRALRWRGMALRRLDRAGEATTVETEVLSRFRDSADAELRVDVARALANRSRDLMREPATFAQGMALSDELIELITGESGESVLGIAEVGTAYMLQLLAADRPGLRGLALPPALTLATNALTAGRAVQRRLPRRLSPPVTALVSLTPLDHRPRDVYALADRARQVRRVEAALLTRLLILENPEAHRLAAQAEVRGRIAQVLLGDVLGATRRFAAMNERRDPDVAAAYVEELRVIDDSSIFGQIRMLALLNQRANALVGEDPPTARIAYDDSVAARLPADRHWVVDVAAWFFAPRPRRLPEWRALGSSRRGD